MCEVKSEREISKPRELFCLRSGSFLVSEVAVVQREGQQSKLGIE